MTPTISLWQPWASLVAAGAKRFETRSWAPPAGLIGKRIAIHAAKKPVFPIVCGLDNLTLEAIERALGVLTDPCWPARLPMGAVLCTAVLGGAYQCGQTIELPGPTRGLWQPSESFAIAGAGVPGSAPLELCQVPIDPFGDYSPGRWAWWLKDVVALAAPLVCTGRQGWFPVDLEAA